MLRALAIVTVLASAASAEDGAARTERSVHGSVGGGGSLLLTGEQGDRWRVDAAIDVKPWHRYGILLAARAFDESRQGLVLGGVIFEAASARPRLVLDLHASLGLDLEARAPAGGGGIRTTLTIYKLLGIAFDLGAYLVIDGFDETRLQIQSTTALVVRW